ncbi:MAG: PBP1A family penicillin-binding protein [Rhodospirillaceae bacterium]|nr:PBP1A family penicillin-binding protein [Rhodospirillaceae bacterium]
MFSGLLTTIVTTVGAVLAGPLGPLDIPDHTPLAEYQPAETTRVFLSDGSLLAEHYVENRTFVPIDQIPPLLVQAFVSAEDQNFYDHHGIDFGATLRAIAVNLRYAISGQSRLFGASTITQQLVKNLLLSRDVTLERKLREAILAARIESMLSKEEILEIYLNQIYLGQGAYGVAAAAAVYFGKPLEALTLGEMAYLAILPKAPSYYHPTRHPTAALTRREYVLARLVEDGFITEEEAAAANAEPLTTLIGNDAIVRVPPTSYFSEEVRRELVTRYGSEGFLTDGLTVRSTMVPELQDIARRALRDGLMDYDRRHGWRGAVATIPVETLPVDQPQTDEATPQALVTPESGLSLREALSEIGSGLISSGGRRPAEGEPVQEPWQAALGEVERPAGTGEWEVAAVLSIAADSAELGFVDGARATLPLAEARWARRRHPQGWVGAAPSRMADVVSPGDVVVVERVSSYDDQGRRNYGLRQIPEVQGAIVAIDQWTGRVLAMVGGFDYDASEFNRVTQALRQPGSAFKPFVYLSALEMGFHPDSLILDSPIAVRGFGEDWRPRNYDGGFLGVIPFRVGVERSRNLATVRLLVEIGIEPVADLAERLGIYDETPRYYSTGLGAGDTSLMRLATAYAMIANGGIRVEPTLIDRIQDRDGHTIYTHDHRDCPECLIEGWRGQATPELARMLPPAEEVADPVAVGHMISILQGVTTRGTAASLAALNLPLAGKTGTTNDAQSVWFMGFSPIMTVGVYVGFDDNRSLGPGETGSSAAVPIFGQFMQEAMRDRVIPPFPPPPEGVAGGGERRDALSALAEDRDLDPTQSAAPTMGTTGTGGFY